MKKTLSMLLVIILLFSLCACNSNNSQPTDPSNAIQATGNSTEAPTDGTQASTQATTSAPMQEPAQGSTRATQPSNSLYVPISTVLSFEVPLDIPFLSENEFAALEQYIYDEVWNTVSAFALQKNGDNARQSITSITLETVTEEITEEMELAEILDEDGEVIDLDVVKTGRVIYVQRISYLLQSQDLAVFRLIIHWRTIVESDQTISLNEPTHCTVNDASVDQSSEGYYILQNGNRLYKWAGEIYDGEPPCGDYYDVETGEWTSDQQQQQPDPTPNIPQPEPQPTTPQNEPLSDVMLKMIAESHFDKLETEWRHAMRDKGYKKAHALIGFPTIVARVGQTATIEAEMKYWLGLENKSTPDGKLYVTVVIDCYSGTIIMSTIS